MTLPDRPEELLRPWISTDEPWDHRKAGHLLRRAGFQGTRTELAASLELGLEGSIERVFSPGEGDPSYQALRELGSTVVHLRDVDKLAAWWLRLMVETPDPLRERLAVLWHGHFAVSAAKVESSTLLFEMTERFRRDGLGDLRQLSHGVTRDPAMLQFLDADSNRRGQPNENLARELLELFLLGIGHYSEGDIQEAARALTGLRVRRGKTEMVERYHDDGTKRVLGESGQLDPSDLVDLCFEQPACAAHFVDRLAEAFVHPQLPPKTRAALASRLREEKYHVGNFLRWLFQTRLFFRADCYRCLIKSPVQYGVGAIRALGARVDGNSLHRSLEAMGQRLFFPPGVQGWTGGEAWISSGRMVARNQFAVDLATSSDRLGAQLTLEDASADSLVKLLLDDELAPEVRTALTSAQVADANLLHSVLTLPEYQLA